MRCTHYQSVGQLVSRPDSLPSPPPLFWHPVSPNEMIPILINCSSNHSVSRKRSATKVSTPDFVVRFYRSAVFKVLIFPTRPLHFAVTYITHNDDIRPLLLRPYYSTPGTVCWPFTQPGGMPQTTQYIIIQKLSFYLPILPCH